MKIGEVAGQTGVGVQTLHYYERQGLLPQPGRTAQNHRVYPPDTLRRVEFIKKAQVVGFTLEEIKELFELCHRPGSHSCRVAEIAEAHLRELTAHPPPFSRNGKRQCRGGGIAQASFAI